MNSVHLLDVEWLLQRQLSQVGDWHNVQYIPESGDPLSQLVSEQHHTNFELWHEEDKARDPDASDAIIATVKRSIDRLNQKRNDEIEKNLINLGANYEKFSEDKLLEIMMHT